MEIAPTALPPDDWRIAVYFASHGSSLAALRQFDRAIERLLEAYRMYIESYGETHARTVEVVRSLAETYEAWHESDPDQRYAEEAIAWRERLETLTTVDESGG